MQNDPFVTSSWRKRLFFHLRKSATICRQPFAPSRIHPDRSGPPNLLILAVDTLRYDHLGLTGYRHATSPVMDELAATGVSFSDVMAPAPWTLPSFASSLTGVMPSLHGASLTGAVRNMDLTAPRRLREKVSTLAGHLSRHGYRTAAFYANPFFAFGLAETFDYHAYHNLPAGDLAWLALEWIRRHADRPFFCFVLFNDPHEPTTPPSSCLQPYLQELSGRGITPTSRELRALIRWGDGVTADYALGRAVLPLTPRTRQALAVKLALYDAAIAYVDQVIGRLRDRLQRWNLWENCLLTLYADHGEEFLDHLTEARRWDHDPREIRAIGHGHTQFQELLHVPWLACGPGIPHGVSLDEPVSLCDVAPTLLEWLGLPPLPYPAGLAVSLRGQSQARAAAGDVTATGSAGGCTAETTFPLKKQDPAAERLRISEEVAFGPDLVAVRRGAWKLIATRSGEPHALYHLGQDMAERYDLCGEKPEIVAQLREALAAWRRDADEAGGESAGGQGWDTISEEVRRRLQELGYAE